VRTDPRRRRLATVAAAVVASATLAGCFAFNNGPAPPGTFTGLGLDTCSAPNTSVMGAWLNSPYRAIGVYVGGETRACSQPNLTASWVNAVAGMGWKLMPIYVGLQAPCNSGFGSQVISTDPNTAVYQGAVDANAAIGRVNQLGLGPGTSIYFDMEAYNNGDSVCSSAVIHFLNGWDAQLQVQGYPAGVYSSAASGMVDLVHQVGNPYFHGPNAIWFAHWPGAGATVWGDSYIPDSYWNFHARIHQYSGGHGEVYGGVWLDIDQDAVDAVLPA